MCNLYTIPSRTNARLVQFLLGESDQSWLTEEPRLIYAFDRPTAPIILQDGTLVPASWTLSPPASDDLPTEEKKKQNAWRSQTYNVRAEEMYSKVTYKTAARQRRCLVPAVSYTEYQHRAKGKVLVPYRMTLPDVNMFGFAGLYNFDEKKGEYRFTILTMPANNLQRWVHNSKPRQPVLLRDEQWEEYFDSVEPEQLIRLLTPSDSDGVVAELSVGIKGTAPIDPPPADERVDEELGPPIMILK